MAQSIPTIEAAYSTLSPAALLTKVVPQYDIPSPTACEFWHRGLNDTYKLSSEKENFILRVYCRNWRTKSAIQFELEALLYLHQKGATVAIPVERKVGGFITSILAPEGERYVMITRYATGEILKFTEAENAITFGQAVADVHHCSSGFQSSSVRHTLDLNHLMDQPLMSIQPYLAHRPSDWEFLQGLVSRISSLVREVGINNLDYGFCHGDCHGENAHVHHGNVTHFDFDCCGYGWRIYDLATFKWVIRLLGKEEMLWSGFLAGYRSVREMSEVDLSLVEPFVAMRDIWYFGLNTANSLAKGRLNDGYIDVHMDFLRDVAGKIKATSQTPLFVTEGQQVVGNGRAQQN
ncbi:phosphotransferase enzyme family protein [Leptothoe sp. PORK10 BA2]|uniref:phosphotransferase enzyme family protein n=1 Tax=Leptothoe sp. PORK10 BA2 TaxID=3110254 RepID=UPI002B2035CB|nr:phosphotransferase [Leptothoe sp. PORK10 BA2]MEA5466245.1 phosphotransferase [Leptothoe sp. PORK10 BA2]